MEIETVDGTVTYAGKVSAVVANGTLTVTTPDRVDTYILSRSGWKPA